MKIFKPTNNQSGLSLIELMVAVAIIGLLATAAIPQYRKSKFKARQVEARTQLSMLYTVERTFITMYGYGSINFYQMGFKPKGNYYYNVGWNNSGNFQRNKLNKYKRKDINKVLTSRAYLGPVVPRPNANGHYDRSINMFGYCKVPHSHHRPRTTDDCTLINGRSGPGAAGRRPEMQIPQTVLGSLLGQTASRNVKVINNGYRDVEFMIGAATKLESKDEWVITDGKKIINIRSGLE